MSPTKRPTAPALLLGLALLCLGVGGPSPAVPEQENPRAQRQEVPGQRDGVLLFLGTDLKPGEEAAADDLVEVKTESEVKKYRRLKEGDRVEPGQLLGRIDDRLARVDLAVAKLKVAAVEAEQQAALKMRDEAEQRYQTLVMLQARLPNAVSQEDLRGAKLTWDRSFFDEISKRQAIEVSKMEKKRAQILLDMHELRSTIRGVVKTIHKNPGEAVRYLEPVLLIEGIK